MANAKKSEEKKAVAQSTAENKSATKETPAAIAEEKNVSDAATVKPAAKTTTRKTGPRKNKAASAEKKETKKTGTRTAKAVKTAEKVADTAKKTTAKRTTKSAEKPATKRTAKAAEKTAAAMAVKTDEKTPVKRGGRKPKPITIDTICEKAAKKISKTKVGAIKEKISVDIEIWGFDGNNDNKSHMYIEVNDGKSVVQPYDYKNSDIEAHLNFTEAVDFINGKTTLKELIESANFYATGNIAKAIKLAAIF